jgi:hypothetical protein
MVMTSCRSHWTMTSFQLTLADVQDSAVLSPEQQRELHGKLYVMLCEHMHAAINTSTLEDIPEPPPSEVLSIFWATLLRQLCAIAAQKLLLLPGHCHCSCSAAGCSCHTSTTALQQCRCAIATHKLLLLPGHCCCNCSAAGCSCLVPHKLPL